MLASTNLDLVNLCNIHYVNLLHPVSSKVLICLSRFCHCLISCCPQLNVFPIIKCNNNIDNDNNNYCILLLLLTFITIITTGLLAELHARTKRACGCSPIA